MTLNSQDRQSRPSKMDFENRFKRHVERAVFDLRRGLPIAICNLGEMNLVVPIEELDSELFDGVRDGLLQSAQLILTENRLAYLGLADPPRVARMNLHLTDSRTDIIRWACDPDAVLPSDRPILPARQTDLAAVALARRGGLLPAIFNAEPNRIQVRTLEACIEDQQLLKVDVDDIFSHCQSSPRVHRISETRIPLEQAPDSRFLIFRESGMMHDQVAILIADPTAWAEPVPVRLHSSCLTGDLFNSLRCDCGSQLKSSVDEINKQGGGVLLYLSQEGRGTGLANKMRAYQLQEEGLDTVEANNAIGFDDDERDYTIARQILSQLGVTRINLLTNNPAKLEALNQAPIQVVNRSGVYGRLTKENRRYLTTKAMRSGHWLDNLLGS